MFYLTTHSTHFTNGYMASDIIMVKEHSDSEKGNALSPHGLLFPSIKIHSILGILVFWSCTPVLTTTKSTCYRLSCYFTIEVNTNKSSSVTFIDPSISPFIHSSIHPLKLHIFPTHLSCKEKTPKCVPRFLRYTNKNALTHFQPFSSHKSPPHHTALDPLSGRYRSYHTLGMRKHLDSRGRFVMGNFILFGDYDENKCSRGYCLKSRVSRLRLERNDNRGTMISCQEIAIIIIHPDS